MASLRGVGVCAEALRREVVHTDVGGYTRGSATPDTPKKPLPKNVVTASGHQPEAFATPFGSPLEG